MSHVPVHQAHAKAADIDSHRHLAACYRDGCSSTLRSLLMSCAWRMVIVVETRGAPEEAALAAADCGSLNEADRSRLSRAVNGPAIYLARVGLDGSSGHHIVRRTVLELHATNAALEAIKAKHAFEGFHIVGQSGGATLAAGLLGLRDDIVCAVMGAGRLSSIRNVPVPDDPALGFFDPSDGAARLVERTTRIMVVTDPEDRIVAAESQTGFVARLHEVGGRARQFLVTSTDRNRHAVTAYAVSAAAGCMRGDSDEAIEQRLAAHVERRMAAAQAAQTREASLAPSSSQPPMQDTIKASR